MKIQTTRRVIKRRIIKRRPRRLRLPRRRLKFNNSQGIGAKSRVHIKLRYMIPWKAGNNTNSYNSEIYNMNSIYSPLAAGGGNQPRYFDQWAAIYNKYIVNGAKVNLFFVSTSNNTQICSAIGGYSHNDTAMTTLTGVYENQNYRVKVLNNILGGSRHSVYYSCPRIEALTKRAYKEEPQFQATTSNSPTFLAKIEIVLATMDGTTNVPANVGYRGWIDYYVTFFEPKFPSQST